MTASQSPVWKRSAWPLAGFAALCVAGYAIMESVMVPSLVLGAYTVVTLMLAVWWASIIKTERTNQP